MQPLVPLVRNLQTLLITTMTRDKMVHAIVKANDLYEKEDFAMCSDKEVHCTYLETFGEDPNDWPPLYFLDK